MTSHKKQKVIIFTILIALFGCLISIVFSQETVTVGIFVDEDTLTISIPTQGIVSLQDFGFEVTVNNQRQTYHIQDYSAFQLRFSEIPAPICLRLVRDNSNNSLPIECDPTRTLIQSLSPADVFWYDQITAQFRTLLILQGEISVNFCAAGQALCTVNYQPPVFTLTPANTATSTITSTSTVTPTVPATLTPLPTPTQAPTQLPEIPRIVFTGVNSNSDWENHAPYERIFDGVKMVLVPAGCFMMGSNDGEEDEQPVHQVCFNQPFWIDKYEVTNGAYGEQGCILPQGDNYPHSCILWEEALDYCISRDSRLPTEAEWEYTARGADSLIYPWGNNFIENGAIYKDNWGTNDRNPAEVGQFPAGASWVGAEDMIGNVMEWTMTVFFSDSLSIYPYPYQSNDGRNDVEPVYKGERSMRGGFYYSETISLRASNRYSYRDHYADKSIGFRCARDYEP